MDSLLVFRLVAVVACALLAFMIFVFASLFVRSRREPRKPADDQAAGND